MFFGGLSVFTALFAWLDRFTKDQKGQLGIMTILAFVVFLAILAGLMPTINILVGNLTTQVGPVEASLAQLIPLALIVSAFALLFGPSQ